MGFSVLLEDTEGDKDYLIGRHPGPTPRLVVVFHIPSPGQLHTIEAMFWYLKGFTTSY